jgi:hypothetical protein
VVPLDQLVARALAAISEGKPEDFVALMGTAEDLRTACPELAGQIAKDGKAAAMEAWIASERERVPERVTACHDLFPWATATQVRREGGVANKEPDKKCPRVHSVSDLEVCMASGDKHYRVRLNSVFLRDGATYGVGRGPTCRETSGEEPPCKEPEAAGDSGH